MSNPSPLPLASGSPCCVVCGSIDARTLTSTPLASGALVLVCGSHAVAHARLPQPARSARELAAQLGERRDAERRDGYRGEIDELAASLATAFSSERRRVARRSADA